MDQNEHAKGALLFMLIYLLSRTKYPYGIAFAEPMSGPDHAPAIFDRWRPWLALAVVLVALAYGPSLARLIATTPFDTAGMRVW